MKKAITNVDEQIGHNINKFMIKNKIKVKDAAKAIGTTEEEIMKIKEGKYEHTLRSVVAVAEGLKMETTAILSGITNQRAKKK